MDRNCWRYRTRLPNIPSLSARRAWIEIGSVPRWYAEISVALRKESVDRNLADGGKVRGAGGRSPQGERG